MLSAVAMGKDVNVETIRKLKNSMQSIDEQRNGKIANMLKIKNQSLSFLT